MALKKIALILNASQEYIRHTDEDEKKYAAEMNILFEAVSDTYLPLLNAFDSLEKDSVPFKVCLVLSPVLCTLLEDPVIQNQYIEWLDKRVEFGKKEIERLSLENNEKKVNQARICLEKAQESKLSFEKYNRKIVKAFHDFAKKGYVELLATCGTDIFLPHYHDMDEVMNAQIETGIYAYRAFFGEMPEGFWLPELGYYPGIEKNVRAYGMNYTVIDATSFLFSENEPEKGIFSPARFENALAVFGKDSEIDNEIFGKNGYAEKNVYLDNNRDSGFELPSEQIKDFVEAGSPRYSFGYKYFGKNSSEKNENIYSYENAVSETQKDAADFVSKKSALLNEASVTLGNEADVSLVESISLNRLRGSWNEGIIWIENLFREARKAGLEFEFTKGLLGNPYTLQKIHPYFGSSSGVGYGEDLLSSRNSWMIRYARKASERMVDLSERFPSDTGLKARLLNLGAKELMLCQSDGLAKMIHRNVYPEYAEMRFKQSINDFTAVFDALGSNTVSTEWLTNLENQHQLFPWMNYRIFNKKR